jgi:basic amino acid/polyamine antiporter, APA family
MARAISPETTSDGGLLRIKPLELILRQADDSERSLKRTMGVVSLTAFGVAAIIGAGIFVLTGVAAATEAGPGIVLSYVAAGLVSALAALCYAELASTVPIAGSAYTYAYAVLGEFIAWIIGWDLLLEYGVGSSAVASGWSSYFADLLKAAFGITLSNSLMAPPFGVSHPGIINLPAVLIVLLLTAMLILGTHESSLVNNIIVGVKLAIILFFIVVGVQHVHSSNWHPFLPFGWNGVFSGASLIFFAYIGFDQVSTAAEEARDPQRTMPRAIILSLVICTALYIAVAGILTGMVKYTRLNNASPVSHAMLQVGLNSAATIISIGAVAGLTTVIIVLLFGQSRILFSMSRDGLLPDLLSRVHPRFRTPYLTNLIIGVLVAVVAGLTPIDELAKLVNIGTLFAFIVVALAIWRLRITNPDLRRGFRVPLVPALPIVTALASLYLITQLPGVTFIRFIIWLAIGLALYFLYSRHHSRLETGEPDPVRSA